MLCETCMGTKRILMGHQQGEDPPPCPTCQGSGEVPDPDVPPRGKLVA